MILSFLLRSCQTYTTYVVVVWVFHRRNGVLGIFKMNNIHGISKSNAKEKLHATM